MSADELLPLPEACRAALEAIERDPLDLPVEVAAHLRSCPSCTEARVQWLALDEAPAALAPAGYFDRLPSRIQGKLPSRTRPRPGHPFLWAAAALLMAGVGVASFYSGRANRAPMVEAALPHAPSDVHESTPDAPFHDRDEVLAEAEQLSPEQVRALLDKLNAKPAR